MTRTGARRWLGSTSLVAAGLVLAWLAVQLGPFLGQVPDLDAMVTLRESLVFFHGGLDGVIAASAGGGVHPPLLYLLSWGAFAVFGEDPRSQQLIAVVLFAILAVAVERLLAPWLGSRLRVAAAVAVAICPSLAINVFLVSYEGLLLVVLAVALVLALAPGGGERRAVTLGAVLALLPLIKEPGLVLVLPFAVHAALTGGPGRAEPARARVWRGTIVLGIPITAALAWAAILRLEGASAWHTWILSTHHGHGSYVIALRAMLGLERGIFLRQNLANGLIVNFLWLPAALALATVGLLARRPGPRGLRSAAALLVGLAVVHAWAVLTFPTYTEPRYATPLTLLTVLLALFGVPLWPRRLRPVVPALLIAAFLLGAWSPTDPVSRAIFGTTSVGGEQVYDTAELERGPDRVVLNFAALRQSRRIDARLRRLYTTDAALVTGDCGAMKLGEKLFSIGLTPGAYDRTLPGARPLRCVPPAELPPGAADGPRRIALVRTPEEDASGRPPAVAGPSIVVVH